jgi:hypothetical protein
MQFRIYKNGNRKIVKDFEELLTRISESVIKRISSNDGIIKYTIENMKIKNTINNMT